MDSEIKVAKKFNQIILTQSDESGDAGEWTFAVSITQKSDDFSISVAFMKYRKLKNGKEVEVLNAYKTLLKKVPILAKMKRKAISIAKKSVC